MNAQAETLRKMVAEAEAEARRNTPYAKQTQEAKDAVRGRLLQRVTPEWLASRVYSVLYSELNGEPKKIMREMAKTYLDVIMTLTDPVCERCGGDGTVSFSDDGEGRCPDCKGSGLESLR